MEKEFLFFCLIASHFLIYYHVRRELPTPFAGSSIRESLSFVCLLFLFLFLFFILTSSKGP